MQYLPVLMLVHSFVLVDSLSPPPSILPILSFHPKLSNFSYIRAAETDCPHRRALRLLASSNWGVRRRRDCTQRSVAPEAASLQVVEHHGQN